LNISIKFQKINKMAINDKVKVKRNPKRGAYDKESIFTILDNDYVCTVAFNYENCPVIIPTIYGRKNDKIYFHGATSSRMIKCLEQGIDICVCVYNVHALVLAKSVFHHSLNYESVILFGNAYAVDDEEKHIAFEVITDQILKDRWKEARLPNQKEIKATSILALDIDQASAKVRAGGPKDDKQDLDCSIWSGIVPIHKIYGQAIPSDDNIQGLEVPASVLNLLK
jgi:nitroimidazol reductase NimA-like FMN-containing flavoprotein (pyridoxamine 5'-phosphate oxidase superfamily)